MLSVINPEHPEERAVYVVSNSGVVLSLGVLMVFAASAFIFSQVIPGPHKPVDYLVIGTAATFASLLTLFLILLKTWVKDPEIFVKRRKK